MKDVCLFVVLLLICTVAYAQPLDRSQYTEIDLFSYLVRGRQMGNGESFQFRMVLGFDFQHGTAVLFRDEANDSLSLQTTRRWPFDRGEIVAVYFAAQHSRWGWTNTSVHHIETIETSTASSARPWLPFVSNDRTDLRGWHLQYLGDGMYREVYYE